MSLGIKPLKDFFFSCRDLKGKMGISADTCFRYGHLSTSVYVQSEGNCIRFLFTIHCTTDFSCFQVGLRIRRPEGLCRDWIHFASSRFYLVLISCLAVALTPNPPHHILSIPVWCGTQISTSKISWMIFVIYSRTNVSQFCFVICFNVLMQHDKTSLRNFDWLIWHKLQRAYIIMNCPSCVIVVVVVNENFLGDIT